jgi:hypothetical protein
MFGLIGIALLARCRLDEAGLPAPRNNKEN